LLHLPGEVRCSINPPDLLSIRFPHLHDDLRDAPAGLGQGEPHSALARSEILQESFGFAPSDKDRFDVADHRACIHGAIAAARIGYNADADDTLAAIARLGLR